MEPVSSKLPAACMCMHQPAFSHPAALCCQDVPLMCSLGCPHAWCLAQVQSVFGHTQDWHPMREDQQGPHADHGYILFYTRAEQQQQQQAAKPPRPPLAPTAQ